MISKVIIAKTFSGACRYVCKDQRRAVVLDVEGVRSYDWKLMSEDFERQHALRPSLHKVVFHGILSFYPGEKIDDEKMIEIAGNSIHIYATGQQVRTFSTRRMQIPESLLSLNDKNSLHFFYGFAAQSDYQILNNFARNNGRGLSQLIERF